jgi:RND family efflux transporter MFP subunit
MINRLYKKRQLLALIALLTLLSACQPAQPVAEKVIRPIKALTIGDADILAGKDFPGVAKATQEVDLSFRVAGVLTKMPIKVGQKVRQGDELAYLDPRDFEVNLANARANIASAKAQLTNAKVEYQRVLRVQKTNPDVVSKSTIDLRLSNFEQAQAAHASAQALVDAAKDRLSYATLKAPFDGTVVRRYIENFQDVIPNKPIFKLVDLAKIEMDVHIPENLISNLPYVRNIHVIFESFHDVAIPAEIKEVSNEASQSTRTYQVRLIMTPPLGIKVLPGMTGRAYGEMIKDNIKSSQVIIPTSAVFSSADAKSTYVWKYDAELKTVNKHKIEKGVLVDQGLVITEGLHYGDIIATAGVHILTEGQAVTLLDNKGSK